MRGSFCGDLPRLRLLSASMETLSVFTFSFLPSDEHCSSMTLHRTKRSRLATGCRRCRVRHLKCDLNIPSCDHCKLAKVDCERGFNVRFRSGLNLDENHDLAFPESAIWPRLIGSFRFCDETLEIQSLYKVVGLEEKSQEKDPLQSICETSVNIQSRDLSSSQPNVSPLLEQHAIRTPHNSSIEQSIVPLNYSAFPSTPNFHHSPSDSSSLVGFWMGRPPRVQGYSFNEREAALMRNYVENMALWADITDPQHHFEVEVPLRATQESVLCFAIFAFSSRHIDRQRSNDAAEALQYHNRCLQLLIPVLSGARDNITDVVLAAVAILRQHEEMDCEDNQFHLTGTTRILNTVSSFGSSGGLGEAAAWLCLREDIHISLTSQKPLRTDLQSFSNSNVFVRNDDFAWSSRMVFLLARLLECAFSYDSPTYLHTLQHIGEEIEDWNSNKPRTFDPIQVIPRGKEPHKRFPGVWMLLPVHVIGVQYYHIAKIILAFSCSPTPSPAYEIFKNSRHIEKTARSHLLTVLGLAKSNQKAENTLFTARHSLVAWGWILRHKLDQGAAEGLLTDMQTRTGWDVAHSIQSLRQQWHEEHSDE